MLRPSSRRVRSYSLPRARFEILESKCLLASSAISTPLESFSFSAENLINLEMTPTADGMTSVSGWLQSSQQTPMVGVPVELGGVTTITDETGYFHFEFATSHIPTSAMAIEVPAGDPWFDPFNTGTQTISMRRAVYSSSGSDGREHPNLLTSFIDASMVYGSDDERAAALRLGVGGKLKVSGGNLLPINNSATFPDGTLENDNAGPIPADALFVAGDVRANENVGLTSLHTLLVREHNRLADSLAAENPSLTDEELYQQARRLLGAMVQHITYNEYLPVLLGEEAIPAYAGYDPSVNPALSTIFSGAAYRVGHTQLPTHFQRLDANMESLPGGNLGLRHVFFNPNPVIEDGIEPYLRGMYATLSQEIDTYVIDDVRNFLFGPPGAGGMDLAAINIQRGRDLGLPRYNQARLDFGLPAIKTFAEVSPDPVVVAALASVYDSVDDIDIWVGGLAEEHVPGAQLGPLFQRIIADQFQRARDGDRYWYENGQFTEEELTLIRGTTLASLVERNTSITGLTGNLFTTGIAPEGPAPAGFAASTTSTDYRTINGHGNNLSDPTAGAAHDHLLTNFTSSYADGISEVDANGLPGAREVSNAVIAQSGSIVNRSGTTALFVFWGQLMDHDLGLTPGGTSDELIIHGDQWNDPAGYQSYPEMKVSMEEMLEHDLVTGTDNQGPIPFMMRPIANGHQNIFAHFEGSIGTVGGAVEFQVSVTPESFQFAAEQTVVGWKVVAEEGSSLDPAAVQIFDASGNLVPTRIVRDDSADTESSFVLVELPPGDYTVIVRGENETVGAFHLEASLAGDADGDRRTTTRDLLSLLDRITSGSPSTSVSHDFDLDGEVTEADLDLAMDNFRNSAQVNPIYLDVEIDPDTGSILSPSITLRGQTLPGTIVEIDTNSDGIIDDQFVAGMLEGGYNFIHDVSLLEGTNIVTVSARDDFGQRVETRIIVPINLPSASSSDLPLEQAPPRLTTTETPDSVSEEKSTPIWHPAPSTMVGPWPIFSFAEGEPIDGRSELEATGPLAGEFVDEPVLPRQDHRLIEAASASWQHSFACSVSDELPSAGEERSAWSEDAVDWMMGGEDFLDGLGA